VRRNVPLPDLISPLATVVCWSYSSDSAQPSSTARSGPGILL
jgi:hypothetical protein